MKEATLHNRVKMFFEANTWVKGLMSAATKRSPPFSIRWAGGSWEATVILLHTFTLQVWACCHWAPKACRAEYLQHDIDRRYWVSERLYLKRVCIGQTKWALNWSLEVLHRWQRQMRRRSCQLWQRQTYLAGRRQTIKEAAADASVKVKADQENGTGQQYQKLSRGLAGLTQQRYQSQRRAEDHSSPSERRILRCARP